MIRGKRTSRRSKGRTEGQRGQGRGPFRIDSPPRADDTAEIKLETENAQATHESVVSLAQILGEGQYEQAQNCCVEKKRGRKIILHKQLLLKFMRALIGFNKDKLVVRPRMRLWNWKLTHLEQSWDVSFDKSQTKSGDY